MKSIQTFIMVFLFIFAISCSNKQSKKNKSGKFQQNAILNVHINKDKTISIKNDNYKLNELKEILEDYDDKDALTITEADKRNYDVLLKVFDIAKEAGFKLVTLKKK